MISPKRYRASSFFRSSSTRLKSLKVSTPPTIDRSQSWKMAVEMLIGIRSPSARTMYIALLTIGLARHLGLSKRALALTDACPEDIATGPAECFLSRYPGDPLRRRVEPGDPPLVVDGEHTVSDAVENRSCNSGVFVVHATFYPLKSACDPPDSWSKRPGQPTLSNMVSLSRTRCQRWDGYLGVSAFDLTDRCNDPRGTRGFRASPAK